MPTLQESKFEARHLVLPEYTGSIETDAGQRLFDEAHNVEGRSN